MTTKQIRVPDIGDFDKVPVIEVLVAEGDSVDKEQSLITLESDKATMEVPSTEAGKVVSVKVSEGDEVSEGDVIAEVEVGEDAEDSEKESDAEDSGEEEDRDSGDEEQGGRKERKTATPRRPRNPGPRRSPIRNPPRAPRLTLHGKPTTCRRPRCRSNRPGRMPRSCPTPARRCASWPVSWGWT